MGGDCAAHFSLVITAAALIILAASIATISALEVCMPVTWNSKDGMATNTIGIGHLKRYFVAAGGHSVEEQDGQLKATGLEDLIREFESLCIWTTDGKDRTPCQFQSAMRAQVKQVHVQLQWITDDWSLRGQAIHALLQRGAELGEGSQIISSKSLFTANLELGSLQRWIASCVVGWKLLGPGKPQQASWCITKAEVRWKTDVANAHGSTDYGRWVTVNNFQNAGGFIHTKFENKKAPDSNTALQVSGTSKLICEYIRLCVWTMVSPPNRKHCACELITEKPKMVPRPAKKDSPATTGSTKKDAEMVPQYGPFSIKWHHAATPTTKARVQHLELVAKEGAYLSADSATLLKDEFKSDLALGTIQRWYVDCAWCYKRDGDEKFKCASWCPVNEVELKWQAGVGVGKFPETRNVVIQDFVKGGGKLVTLQDDIVQMTTVTIFKATARRSLFCEFIRLCIWKEIKSDLENCECSFPEALEKKADDQDEQKAKEKEKTKETDQDKAVQAQESSGWVKSMRIKWAPGVTKDMKEEFYLAEFKQKDKVTIKQRTEMFVKLNAQQTGEDIRDKLDEFPLDSVHLGTLQRWYSACLWCYAIDSEQAKNADKVNWQCPSWCTVQGLMTWRKDDGYGKAGYVARSAKESADREKFEAIVSKVFSKAEITEIKFGTDSSALTPLDAAKVVEVTTTREKICDFARICVWEPGSVWLDGCDCEFKDNPNKQRDQTQAIHVKWTSLDTEKMKKDVETNEFPASKKTAEVQANIKLVKLGDSDARDQEAKKILTAEKFTATLNLGTIQRWYIACAWCYSIDKDAPSDMSKYKCAPWCAKSKQ